MLLKGERRMRKGLKAVLVLLLILAIAAAAVLGILHVRKAKAEEKRIDFAVLQKKITALSDDVKVTYEDTVTAGIDLKDADIDINGSVITVYLPEPYIVKNKGKDEVVDRAIADGIMDSVEQKAKRGISDLVLELYPKATVEVLTAAEEKAAVSVE